MVDKSRLLQICRTHLYEEGSVVVPEPYIPHFVDGVEGWNGTIVVAVAQNLSDRSEAYRSWLLNASEDMRLDRLNVFRDNKGRIGVGPWDNGTIKLAVAAVVKPEVIRSVAISNAVVWSGSDNGMSEALPKEAINASVAFWRDILDELKPLRVCSFGSTANLVIKRTGIEERIHLELPGAFPRNYNVGFRMNTDRLLRAFPEVAEAFEELHSTVTFANPGLAIHCACASVSKRLERMRGLAASGPDS